MRLRVVAMRENGSSRCAFCAIMKRKLHTKTMFQKKLRDVFERFARRSSIIVGSGAAFCTAIALIIIWLWLGPLSHFSNTWQLAINTLTTISTFLMVFLLQNSQNHDTAALHVKLNELIRIHKDARNVVIGAERFDDRELALENEKFLEVLRKTTDGHPLPGPLPVHKNQKHKNGDYETPVELSE